MFPLPLPSRLLDALGRRYLRFQPVSPHAVPLAAALLEQHQRIYPHVCSCGWTGTALWGQHAAKVLNAHNLLR